MTQSSTGSPNPFDAAQRPESADGTSTPSRTRRLSIPLRMDDGTVRTFAVPSALEHPSQFSVSELERLTRAYAEALGLLKSSR